jgi:hypothetical protein
VKYGLAGKKSTKSTDEALQSLPCLTPEEMENRLIALSYAAIENRILNGTATGAELVYFAKAGSVKQRQEIEKLREENSLLRAKTSAIESEKERAVSYREVLEALQYYRTESQDVPFDPYVY